MLMRFIIVIFVIRQCAVCTRTYVASWWVSTFITRKHSEIRKPHKNKKKSPFHLSFHNIYSIHSVILSFCTPIPTSYLWALLIRLSRQLLFISIYDQEMIGDVHSFSWQCVTTEDDLARESPLPPSDQKENSLRTTDYWYRQSTHSSLYILHIHIYPGTCLVRK